MNTAAAVVVDTQSRPPDTLLRGAEVSARIGVSLSKLYLMMAAGEFPRPVKIGAASRWPASVVHTWIAERVEQHRAGGSR